MLHGKASLLALAVLVLAPLQALAQSPAWVVFKLPDDSCASADGDELSAPELDVEPINDELVIADATRVLPLHSLAVEVLDEMRAEAEEVSGMASADLTQYFWAQVDAADADDLVAALAVLEMVDHVHVMPEPVDPPCDPDNDTPSFVSEQQYRGVAPLGVGAGSAQAGSGNRGAGVTIADVEYDWDVAHQDLCGGVAAPDPLPDAAAVTNFRTTHGTAVLGVLWADEDDSGRTGIAPEATVKVFTQWRDGEPTPNVEDALSRAASELEAGDVLLIEAQSSSDCPGFGFVPVEYLVSRYDEIQQAVQRGIHVVEAAGNSSDDLDDYFSEDDCDSGLRAFHLEDRDSGAIIVGASTLDVPAVRTISNHGLRIDAYSHGTCVDTLGGFFGLCGDGEGCAGHDDGPQDEYTCSFNGSSSASAIVAGCVAVLEGAHVDIHGGHYNPQALRMMLRTSGTLPDPNTQLIGRQPNLVDQIKIIEMGPQPAAVFTGLEPDPSDLTNPGPFGRAVATIQDLDDDGVREIIVGAQLQGTADGGAVFIFSGLTGALLRSVTDAHTNAQFGATIAVGRVNTGAVEDYVVAAMGSRGHVLAFDGTDDSVICDIDSRDFNNGNAILSFGTALAVGDLDDDGKGDIAIGAPSANITNGMGGGGRVLVISGDDCSTVLLDVSTTTGGQDRLGASVAIGDFTGEGEPGLVAGAPQFSSSKGRIRAFAGGSFDPLTIDGLEGAVAGDGFGEAVMAFDMNGDGDDEVAVSAPNFDTSGSNNFGRVRVFNASSTTPIRTIDGTASNAGFGKKLANAGNIDDDWALGGFKEDIIIASPDASPGKVRVFTLLSDTTPVGTYVSQSGGGALGTAVAGNTGGSVFLGDPSVLSNRGRIYQFKLHLNQPMP